MKTGRKFENNISLKLQSISKKGRGFFIKSPTPMKMIKNGDSFMPVYANKALCDFIGIYNTKFILIEAKYISGARFDFDRLKEHQEKQLASIMRHGGVSMIIFGIENEMLALEIDEYLVYKSQTDRKSINVDTLKKIARQISIDTLEEFIDLASK